MLAMLLGEMLEEMGHKVCAIAATEADAVAAAEREHPGLMIVDARLGNGSGVSAVADIVRTGHIPHFFMSGNTASVSALRPDALVLSKPFGERQLAGAIVQALGGAS
jgi:CheY-like chemotaxis protein